MSLSCPPKRLALGRFELRERLGRGCFGEVYLAIDTLEDREVAVKLERYSSRPGQMQLAHEAKVLSRLAQVPQPQGFAEFYRYCEEGRHNAMVIERLGKNLEDRFVSCANQFSVRTTVLIADQVLHAIEYMHSKGFVHRDIKPDNFMCGVGPRQHHIYLTDFGLSSTYFDRKHVAMNRTSWPKPTVTVMLLALVLLAQFSSAAGVTWEGINSKIQQDFPTVQSISVEALAAQLKTVPLIDVRAPAEFAVSHLEGSMNLETAPEIAERFPDRQARLNVYCSVGYRSAETVAALQRMGYVNARNVRGSIFEWANKGYPVYSHSAQVHTVHPFNSVWGVLLNQDLHPGAATS